LADGQVATVRTALGLALILGALTLAAFAVAVIVAYEGELTFSGRLWVGGLWLALATLAGLLGARLVRRR
jgi:hypothetical protein